MEIDNYPELKLPVSLEKGDLLKYEGGDEAVLYDKSWNVKKKIRIDPVTLTVSNGKHSLNFDCAFSQHDESMAKIELRIAGEPETVRK